MSPRPIFLSLVLAAAAAGCGKSEATRPPGQEAWHRPRDWWDRSKLVKPELNPDQAPLEKVLVEIEEAEVLKRGVVEIGEEEDADYYLVGPPRLPPDQSPEGLLLALKVKVFNRHDALKLRVGPRRFLVETESKKTFKPVPSSVREPPLRESYLKSHCSVSGWLFFRIPSGETKLMLKSDLRRPPLSVMVPTTLR